MKSERRHQLETNELADRIGSGISSVQSVLPMILGGLAAITVGAVAWGLYSNSAKKAESAAWTEYYFNLAGGDADAFLDVANGFPKSSAAGWAQQTAGDSYLERGIQAMYQNRAEGVELIEQAIDAFEGVLEGDNAGELRGKALLGLAQAHESLGHLDEAENYYQQFIGTDSPPRLLSTANERLAFLNSEPGKNFYDWFGKLDPKPDAPIQLPSDLAFPPSEPDIQFDSPAGSATEGAAAGVGQTVIDPATLPALPDVPNLPDVPVQTDGTGALQLEPPAATGEVEVPDSSEPPAGGESETPAEAGTGTENPK